MPTPILKVPIDDAAFQRFLKTYEKYQRQLNSQPDMWKGVNDSIKGVTIAGAAMAAEIAHQAEQTRQLRSEEDKREESAKRADTRKRKADREEEKREENATKRRRHAIEQVRKYASTVTDTAMRLGKWASFGGLAGLATGALGLWGLDNLISGVGQERRLSSGLGVSMGQRQGMGLAMQRYFDVNSALETVANMQASPGQWGTFRMMGINPQGKSPAELTYEAAAAARRMFKADKGNLQLAQAQGLTNIFSADDLRRMAHEGDAQFNASQRQGRNFQGLSDEVGRKWQNFMVTVDTAKLKFENSLIGPLTKFEPLLEEVVNGFSKMLTNLFNNPAVQHGIDTFAKWLGSPAFQSDLAEVGHDLEYLAQKVASALRILGLLPDNPADNPYRPSQGPGPAGVPSTTGTVAQGPLGRVINTTKQAAWVDQQLQNWGWTPAQVKGIRANISAESNYNPFAVGDSGKAYGIAQWHPDRQAAYAKLFGHTMQSVTNRGQALKEQLQFMQYELTRGSFKKAGDDLRRTHWAYSAGYTMSKEYERPRGGAVTAAARGAAATMITVKVNNQTGASVATTVNSAAGGR